ncbi:MAG: hypothetical protein PVI56_05985, partial [Gammaproteobacteria bacterium]
MRRDGAKAALVITTKFFGLFLLVGCVLFTLMTLSAAYYVHSPVNPEIFFHSYLKALIAAIPCSAVLWGTQHYGSVKRRD